MKLFTVLLMLSFTLAAVEPDTVLRETRRYIAAWLIGVDDFVCHQSDMQYAGDASHGWRLDDQSLSELTVRGGVEYYVPLEADGRYSSRTQPALYGRANSRGEFVSAVRALFDPASKATFHLG